MKIEIELRHLFEDENYTCQLCSGFPATFAFGEAKVCRECLAIFFPKFFPNN